MTNLLVQTKLDDWTSGRIVAERAFRFGTIVRVTVDDDARYTVLRAFPAGDGAEISVDKNEITHDEVIEFLLERAGEDF